MYIQNRIIVLSLSLIGVILTSMVVVVFTISPAQAETGQGDDVFRVIMTIFGVDESKGDVIAFVTKLNVEGVDDYIEYYKFNLERLHPKLSV